MTAKEADLGGNEAKEGHHGSNRGILGFPVRSPDRFRSGIDIRAGAIGIGLGELIREDVLERAVKSPADLEQGLQ